MKLDELFKIINSDVGDGTTVSDSDAFTRRETAKKFLEKHAVIVLPELVEEVELHLKTMDALYKTPATVERGRKIANSVNRLELAKTRAETVLTDGK